MRQTEMILAVALLTGGVAAISRGQSAPSQPPRPAAEAQETRDAAHLAAQESREAIRHAAQELKASGIAIPAALAALQGVPMAESLFGMQDARVSVDFNNVTLKDALQKLFDEAKADYDVDSDVPVDARVTLKAKNVRLVSALQALADQAGISWTTVILHRKEEKQFRARVRIVRSAPRLFRSFTAVGPASIYSPQVPTAFTDMPGMSGRGVSFAINIVEQRQTFVCPHCKGRVTTVRAKSSRQPQSVWRFCPICGKAVDMEDNDDDHAAMVGRLEPGCQVKIVVVSTPDDKQYDGTYAVDSAGLLRLRTYPITVRVSGLTTGRLEQVLTTRLRTYLRDPRVNATIVTKK